MKKTLSISLILTIVLIANTFQAQAQDGALEMLKHFYKQYIIESQKMPSPARRKNISEIKKQNCTQNFLIKIATEELDSDPFLKAQDIDSSCLKTLAIKRDLKKDNLYQVTYLDSYNHHNIIITVTVIKQKDEFKIDDIW